MSKELIKGLFTGILAPIAAFIVYVAFCTEDSDPVGMYNKIVEIGKLSHVISLSLLINLLIFFMNSMTCISDNSLNNILLELIRSGLSR